MSTRDLGPSASSPGPSSAPPMAADLGPSSAPDLGPSSGRTSDGQGERGPCRLLIVDDDQFDRAKIRRLLRRRRDAFELREVTTIQEALALVDSRAFDCALVDFRLPDGTALDLMAKLDQDAPSRLPIIVLTGLDDEAIALQTLQRGAQDYIIKDELDERLLCRAIRYSVERLHVADMQRRLSHADRLISVGQLAAGIAHEINNPASYVLCNLELLEGQQRQSRELVAELRRIVRQSGEDTLAAEVEGQLQALEQTFGEDAEMLRDSLHGIEQIGSIVGELKSFSRVSSDSVAPTDLDAVVRSACKIAHHEIRRRARLTLERGHPPTIAADHAKLVQVFTNLLINAAQSIEPGATEHNEIRVSTRTHGDFIRVTIEDTGAGIPPSVLPRVFDPFFTTKPRSDGAGLGLPLCLDLVRKHGGQIELHSTVGVGTRVEVVIPTDTGLAPHTPTHSKTDAPPAAQRARVLIIDDESQICRVYQRILAPHHDVQIANGGRLGLELLRSEARFDIVLCDIMMPDLDGITLYARLREEDPDLVQRFVFCTGGAISEQQQGMLDTLTVPMLDKPVNGRELLRTVARVAGTPAGVDS
ncbi:MAG: response regulator [Myxococcota bacterium]